ncbi:MAG: glucosamine-6-phosphate deaminase [Bacteroidota bacterium]|nr:glucosamine-6-phosphate deaminase [Bacteroidota bacterium]
MNNSKKSGIDFERRYEKMETSIFSDALQASIAVAGEVAALIREKQEQNRLCILGLPTGSSPITVYEELVRMHNAEGLSFRNVVTFNLDEYYPMHPDSLQSYHRFMNEHLFDHIDILPENVNIPDGMVTKEKISGYCQSYDEKIESYGGIDLQLLGIGRTGHIGFNEPGSPINSITRVVTLDYLTRTDASSDFFGEENVPLKAITMGVGTIMRAKRIILMAWGEGKAQIIKKAIEGPVTDNVPTTYLQNHPDTKVMLDDASSAELTRIKTPWLVRNCQWNDRLIRKAVTLLCLKQNKSIMKLTERDYNDNGLSDLVTENGPANKINIKVFNDLQHTITGWPGGKPNADDSTRPERSTPYPKRVLVFSPHPDDDVISMGGTLARLADQGHDVYIAYQTSGSISVFDHDVLRYLQFIGEYKNIFKIQIDKTDKIYDHIKKEIENKKPGQIDTDEVMKIKSAIRKGEALSAIRYMSIPEERVHFLDMPFYDTGKVKKNPLGEGDIKLVTDIINKLKPHQIYAAGDLSDPHGTHRVCMNAIIKAIDNLKDKTWMKDCRVWLYRGAWQEWDIDQVDMAVPLSPEEALAKRNAIFKHQSQKDRPLFPGFDSREFWQRAEERNHATAVLYDKLGMAEYQAIEVFVRYYF